MVVDPAPLTDAIGCLVLPDDLVGVAADCGEGASWIRTVATSVSRTSRTALRTSAGMRASAARFSPSRSIAS